MPRGVADRQLCWPSPGGPTECVECCVVTCDVSIASPVALCYLRRYASSLLAINKTNTLSGVPRAAQARCEGDLLR